MTASSPALDVDALHDAAAAKAGHDRFGDGWYREPLGVLVDALNRQARLSDLGLDLTRRRLTALLVDRLRLRALQAEHPGIQQTEVVVAAEICGLPRTGSTLLHRLLAASPQLTSTLSWECSYPVPFPGEGPDAAVRKAKAKKMMELFLEYSPDFGDIHTVVWDGPEEDVLLLDRTFTSQSFDSFYWVPDYGVWLRSFDQSKAYAELREWLQVLQWQDPARAGQRWVLKSPHHLTAAGTVLDEFPDCKIVMTHRSPVSAVPSYASMVAAMTAQYSDQADPQAIGPYWSERFVDSLTKFAAVRAQRPDRVVDVPFAATVSQPLETARTVLEALGLQAGPADLAAFEAYLEINQQERHGAHSYCAEDFGLSASQLERDFAFYERSFL
jgi:Sulfotransferase family